MPHTVPSGLRILLSGLLDYAGLFPPARLPLDEAIGRYARYRQAPEAWMLARFVIPVGRLPDLAPHAALFATAPPFRFAVLGSGGPTPDAFLEALAADLVALVAFQDRHAGQVRVEAMEVRLPEALHGASPATLRPFFEAVLAQIEARFPEGLLLFFELPLDAPRHTLPPALAAMAAVDAARAGLPPVCLKVRTGGLTADAFPSPEALAEALAAARDAGVPFKATAGLHHPLRHHPPAGPAPMHGFLNVFGAAVLAHTHGLDAAAIEAILREEDSAAFRFTDEGFAWRHLAADVPGIRTARTRAVSFGSCSFDEPRDDLRALGLL